MEEGRNADPSVCVLSIKTQRPVGHYVLGINKYSAWLELRVKSWGTGEK